MLKCYVWDLDDTLFDNTEQIGTCTNDDPLPKISPFSDAKEVLSIPGTHVLLTQGRHARQLEKLKRLKLKSYFKEMIICSKTIGKFEILKELKERYERIIVIGDRVDREISYGNQLGMHTIRKIGGKYDTLIPKSGEIPTHTIQTLKEIKNISVR